MIKGISFLRQTGTPSEFERLSSFFSALGFTPGSGWNEDGSRGASFLAPLGNLELVDGAMPVVEPLTAQVIVEVTQLDAVREAAIAWFRSRSEEPFSYVSETKE